MKSRSDDGGLPAVAYHWDDDHRWARRRRRSAYPSALPVDRREAAGGQHYGYVYVTVPADRRSG